MPKVFALKLQCDKVDNQPFVPLLDTPRIMYLRQKMNSMNNGNETMQTAAILSVVRPSAPNKLPPSNGYKYSPAADILSENPRVTQLVIICQLAVLISLGQMYEFQVPINFSNVIETNVGAVNGTITFIK